MSKGKKAGKGGPKGHGARRTDRPDADPAGTPSHVMRGERLEELAEAIRMFLERHGLPDADLFGLQSDWYLYFADRRLVQALEAVERDLVPPDPEEHAVPKDPRDFVIRMPRPEQWALSVVRRVYKG